MAVKLRQHVLKAVKHRVERRGVAGELAANQFRECAGVAVVVPPELRDLVEALMQPPALGFAVFCAQLRFQLCSRVLKPDRRVGVGACREQRAGNQAGGQQGENEQGAMAVH